MSRDEAILAALAPAGGKPHAPVQVQKLLFLLDREAHALIGGPYFNFVAYHYGPYDKEVYRELEQLDGYGMVTIRSDGWQRSYALTPRGQRKGERILRGLPPEAKKYIRAASEFVLSLGFSELVSAIYKAYPDMRENSLIRTT